MISKLEQYFRSYFEKFKPYNGSWSYEDGVILKGALNLYQATKDESYWDFIANYLQEFVDLDGNLKGYNIDEYNIDHINAGKILFYAYEKTKDERYKKAIENQMDQLRSHPRIPMGNFWHKNRYPHQVWLDGLYMALPFYAKYETTFNNHQEYKDIYHQFMNVKNILKDKEKGLYYHGYDDSKSIFWCNSTTGLSKNFWLRAEGWLLMALVDCVAAMDESILLDHKDLENMAREAIVDVMDYQDEKSGLWYQVIDAMERDGNYLEVSGSAMVIYAILKAVRLNILDDSYVSKAIKGLNGILDVYAYGEDEICRIGGIVEVAGLGGFDGTNRDGSYEYYISEKVVSDEAKGIGPLMMAYAEYLYINID